jgi:hypothetical protein
MNGKEGRGMDKNKRGVVYSNGATVKWKNKRVVVSVSETGSVKIQFRIADKDPNKLRASHTNLKNKVAVTCLKLTPDAMLALTECLVATCRQELAKERLLKAMEGEDKK